METIHSIFAPYISFEDFEDQVPYDALERCRLALFRRMDAVTRDDFEDVRAAWTQFKGWIEQCTTTPHALLLEFVYGEPEWRNYQKAARRHQRRSAAGKLYKARSDKKAKEKPRRRAALAAGKRKSRCMERIRIGKTPKVSVLLAVFPEILSPTAGGGVLYPVPESSFSHGETRAFPPDPAGSQMVSPIPYRQAS